MDSHDAILSAAKHLFMQQGFRGISMRQIAEAVGVTKAALYYHFPGTKRISLSPSLPVIWKTLVN
ncbi:MAG: helix-turn-helix transcriptional regulator [Anaerolineales bacterium]|nr:helix-turn-helix transcriptional regulator [Anaerolineales bacterium]